MKHKYGILGAGITGLSIAYHLKGKDYALFEKENMPGGVCRSVVEKGFLFDFAEHFLRLDNPYVKQFVSNLLKDNIQKKVLNSSVYLRGSYVEYPFQTNLHGLPEDLIVECLMGYIEAYYGKKHESANFEEWIYDNFGEGIAKYFMIPYNRKIWTVHPRNMTIDWFFNESIVPKSNPREVIEGAINKNKMSKKLFRWYPKKGGIESLATSFLPDINNLYLGKKAEKISLSEKKVVFNDESIFYYKYLINTIPLPELIKILEEVPEDVKKACDELKYNSVLCVNLGVNRSDLSTRHWIYFPDEEYIFARAYFPMNFSKHTVPKGKSSVSAIITFSEDKPLEEKDIYGRVIKDLISVGILNEEDEILVKNTLNIKYGFVIYDMNRSKNVGKIIGFLKENDIISIGRYGKWEYSGIEHAIMDGKCLSEFI